MRGPRKIEPPREIQQDETTRLYDRYAKAMRNRAAIHVEDCIRFGITDGEALEIGPGPGYMGLEWLKATEGTALTGCEISREMVRLAQRNARAYGLEARAKYILCDCARMPFAGGTFDAVFSNDSLHAWQDPAAALREIYRVLKPGGRFLIADFRSDPNPAALRLALLTVRPRDMRARILEFVRAAYTAAEVQSLLEGSAFINVRVRTERLGLVADGVKKPALGPEREETEKQ